MTDYARPGSGETPWIEIDGAFTIVNGQSTEVVDPDDPGQNVQIALADKNYPHGWADSATPEELEAIGAKEILPPDSQPAGCVETGRRLIDFEGSPKREIVCMPIELGDAKVQARANLAAARWMATQFFTYDGVRTQADAAIGVVVARLELRRQLSVPPEVTTKFKLADGEFRNWDEAALVAFGIALGGHIQTCFDLEGQADEQIEAAVTAAAALEIPDTVAWPE